jgi:hypothetical protein
VRVLQSRLIPQFIRVPENRTGKSACATVYQPESIWEDKMRIRKFVRAIFILMAFGFAGGALRAQSWEMPSDAQRCTS